jgi:hypothetical protein
VGKLYRWRMKLGDHLPRPELPSDIAAAIGHQIATFNWVEWTVADLLEEMMEPKVTLDPVLAGMTFSSVVRSARNALGHVRVFSGHPGDELRERIDTVLARLERLAAERNNIAHGVWISTELAGFYPMLKRARDGSAKWFRMTASEIDKGTVEFQAIATELQQLRDEYITLRDAQHD